MDARCYKIVSGAGLEPILMPRKEYFSEHRRLLKALKSKDPKLLDAEYAEQSAEVKRRGGSGASGFIARMMAEAKLKHKGQYRNPTSPLDPKSTMKAPVAFDYSKMANEDQDGENESPYGASPFIIKHFGRQEPVVWKPKKKTQESEAQKEYRKSKLPPKEEKEDLKKKFYWTWNRRLKDTLIEPEAEAKTDKGREEATKQLHHAIKKQIKQRDIFGKQNSAAAEEQAEVDTELNAFENNRVDYLMDSYNSDWRIKRQDAVRKDIDAKKYDANGKLKRDYEYQVRRDCADFVRENPVYRQKQLDSRLSNLEKKMDYTSEFVSDLNILIDANKKLLVKYGLDEEAAEAIDFDREYG